MKAITELKPPVDRALELLGGPSAAAQRFLDPATGRALTAWAVSKWRKRLPADRVIPLAEATGWRVTPHELNPGLYPNPNDGLPQEQAA